jgi:hypothetical protein
MARLLVLCDHPYHLPRENAEAWLRQELETVVRRDGLAGATLTRLGNPSAEWTRSFDWLIEFHLAGLASTAMGRGGACGELVADLRLLGMAPAVALVDDRAAIQLQPT